MNPILTKLLRSHYITLQGYVSAGMEHTKDESTVFLNANENPFELPGLEGFNRYPEPQPAKLLEGYAQMYGVKPTNIVMTRGADEAIMMLTKLFCEPGEDAILIHPPTFGIYTVYGNTAPAKTIEVPLLKKNGTFELDVDGMIAAATNPENKIKLTYLCSPNNPTGTAFPPEQILKIVYALKEQSIVILDETYAEFSKQGSLTKELVSHPNLIILRTLSKSYALAGQRMGTLLSGDEDFITLARTKALEAYPLPVASVKAALHVMDPLIQEHARNNIKKLLEERDRVITGFKTSKLVRHIYPTDGNFFLVEMENAKGFSDYCAQHKFILRDFSSKPLTEDCLRISLGLPKQNDQLIKLLNDYEQSVWKCFSA